MYEQFGGLVDQATKIATFKLFAPDGDRAPSQYEGGGLPRISNVSVVGSFQQTAWETASAVAMPASDYVDPDDGLLKGVIYSARVGPLADGFYEYKYRVTFDDGTVRHLTDPCGRYGGATDQNSGFVVGGAVENTNPIAKRLPYGDLRIYELMIDDFTVGIKSPNQSPLQAIADKLDYLVSLGVNAIEFMPWTAWAYRDRPDDAFSWGYNPVQYFSVDYKYTMNPTTDLDKLVYLTRLINACHQRGIHVIMDGVFNHADAWPADRGFPYFWVYQDTADSPYVGNFAQHAYFKDLDYANRCTLEYIRDACIYWIERFKVDGIRLDNTLGFYKPDDRGHGLPKLLSELRNYLSKKQVDNFSLILEHSWDFEAVDVTNKLGATSCWLDPYRSVSMDMLGDRPNGDVQVHTNFMRILDAARDFDAGRAPTIYIENHDHRRIMRKTGAGQDLWYLTQPYMIALFTSPGATLIYNGQEFGQNDDMPEDGDGRVVPRPVAWSLLKAEPGKTLFQRYQQVLKIRDEHPGLRSPNFYPSNWDESHTQLDADGYGIDTARKVIVYHRWGPDSAGKMERFYVALNFSASIQHVGFRVPTPGPWRDLLSGADVPADGGGWLQSDVNPKWGAIFYRRD